MSISGASNAPNAPIFNQPQVNQPGKKGASARGTEAQDSSADVKDVPIPNPFVKPEKMKRKALIPKKRINPQTGEVEDVEGDDAFFMVDDMDLSQPQATKHRNGLPQLPGRNPEENRKFRNEDLPEVLEMKTGINLRGLKETMASTVEQLKSPDDVTMHDYKKVIEKSYDSALEWNEFEVG